MTRFHPMEAFEQSLQQGYSLLPLNFHRLPDQSIFMSNMVGEWALLPDEVFREFVQKKLSHRNPYYSELKSKHFLVDADSSVAFDLLALKTATKLEHLTDSSALYIFVVTLRCEHSCPYCQVSRQSDDKDAYDMSWETAKRSLDIAFSSPAARIKIEFQGGEPLLNIDLVRKITMEGRSRAAAEKRDVQFVIATNLALLSDEVLEFCKTYDVLLSTSVDGPAELHNANRPRRGNDSYERAVTGIARARNALGPDRVSALMTTTKRSLRYPREIVDTYRSLGFAEIFLRPLSPYGFAKKTKWFDAYTQSDWLRFYFEGLDYIISLNLAGERMVELYASTILLKMLTPYPGRFVDMMNPAGIGTQVLVFNYDGFVYASDESRMLAEMGDRTFAVGRVDDSSIETIILSEPILASVEASYLESAPMCEACAFNSYCGADPVYHHATQGDFLGLKPFSGFCERQMSIFEGLLFRMKQSPEVEGIFRSWVSNR